MALWKRTVGWRTRKPVDMTRVASCDSRVPTAVEYMTGKSHKHIRTMMAERFATVVERIKDPDSGKTTSHILRSKPAAAAAIALGLQEVAVTALMQRINRERATLYSFGARYGYDPAPETFGADVADLRAASEHVLMCQRMDWIACGVGSSAMMIQVIGDRLNYQQIDPDKIWIGFAETIIEDDEERPVNQREIEDASCIVIQLAGTNEQGQSKYVAIFGASGDYPRGRQVAFFASSKDQIPAVGSGDASEYMDAEGIGNPLTIWKQRQNDPRMLEYPIAVCLGEVVASPELMPVNLSLFEQSKEIDLSYSRLLMSGLKGARGVFELHRDAAGSVVLPDNVDEGIVVTESGITLKTHSPNSGNVTSALQVVDALIAHTAASYGIPLYKVSISQNTAVPSGVALQIMNQPMMMERQRRIELNRAQNARMFAIEMALVSATEGTPIGAGVVESWEPNPIPVVVDEREQREIARADLEMKVASVERVAMRLFSEINTVEQARNYIEELKTETMQETKAAEPVVAQPAQTGNGVTPRLFAARRGA